MTHEYKLFRSSVFCWKLPVTSRGETEGAGVQNGKDLACEPQVLMALLRVSAIYIYSSSTQNMLSLVQNENISWGHRSVGLFSLRRHWNTYFLNVILIFSGTVSWLLCPTTTEWMWERHQYFILKIFSRFAPASTLNSPQQNSVLSYSISYFPSVMSILLDQFRSDVGTRSVEDLSCKEWS